MFTEKSISVILNPARLYAVEATKIRQTKDSVKNRVKWTTNFECICINSKQHVGFSDFKLPGNYRFT